MKNKTRKELQLEVEKLKTRLAEAEETLRAIRSGEVDALVVSTPQGDQVFTLKGAERPYRILMEKMKDGAVTLAGDDTIFYCNQGFADMLKMPLEKMIGTGISQFVSPANKAVFKELLRQGRESGSKGEATFLAGDGTAIPTHLSINAMLLDGLSIIYLVATDITEHKMAEEALQKAHDELEIRVEERTVELAKANEELKAEITEHKRAEDMLRESEQRYATTLASIGDAVIATDIGGRITFMNAVAEELTGWSLAEAVTQPVPRVFRIINMQTRQTVEDPISRVLMHGMIVGLANHTLLIRKDGAEIPIDDSGAPIRDGDGKTMGVVLVFRDITERKQAEEALRRAYEELEMRVQERTAELGEANEALQAEITVRRRSEEHLKESLKEKEILLKEVHHRVKNNMQVISSLLMLQEDLSEDKKIIETLKDSQNRISSMALIHERLYRSGTLSKIDLKEYIDDLVSGLFQSYGVSESRVALNINVENVLLGIDSAIPCGLIINELVSNSLKHAFLGAKSGEIKIFLRLTDENMIELVVGDNGIGIPEDMDIRKTKSLGLYLVTLLVENQLHGEITLNQEKGTEFQIKFREAK